ncbi:hypothetical protein BUALT_Bualt09G0022200 [Buddleja alternifolia]|uniref:SWIM-type domain-containing protein n=1 Tax=Buddleja alternifolia TaxID=168488 RepID=A0AAV6X7F5_9LAMI|nr:hypothetical protein BUALT_Bualt09G0022200 [Buddleja alternifolia]
MYEKIGGKSAIIDMYYRLPGLSMDKGLRKFEGDSDCLEIYRQYKGKSVVPIYIEDVRGPLAALDAENNPINLEQPISAICYPSDYNEMMNVLDEAESNFGDLAQGVNDLGTEINASDLDEDVNTGVNDENEINIGDLGEGGSAESVTENNNGETENNFGPGLNDDGENENNVGGFSEDVHEENSVNEEHDNTVHEYENKQANNKYRGRRIEHIIRDNLNETLDSLQKKIRRDLEIECSMHKIYRAKRYVLELMKGDTKQQYNLLYNYCETVVKHNPTSTLILKVDRSLNPLVLERMYFCLPGIRVGFLDGCRPIIGLDGCFLKGLYKGQLLCATGRDGNDSIYLIAMAYVEIEKFETWEWFLALLLRDIGSHEEKGWAFISDRQHDLLEAVSKLAPQAEHRFCLRHMYNIFKGRYKEQQLKNLFWKVASTYNVKQHLKVMREIQRISPKRGSEVTAYEWLCNIPSTHWARCFFPIRSKSDVIVNNISESFNNYILEARELPIIEMFEAIRRKCMIRIQVKRAGMEKYNKVVFPNILTKIEKQREFARNCHPTWAGDDKFEVMHYMENHVVYLNDRHCSCGFFQLCGYLCCHAIVGINNLRLETDDYVDDCFKKERYLRIYNHMVNPVPGMHEYEESTLGIVNPPNVKTRLGRPKKKRMRYGNDRESKTKGAGGMELLLLHKLKIPSQTDVPIESVNLSDYFEVPQTATQASSSIHPRPRSRKQQTPQPRRIPNQASATAVTQRTESMTSLERI